MNLQSIVQIVVGIWLVGIVTYFIYKVNQQEKLYKNLK